MKSKVLISNFVLILFLLLMVAPGLSSADKKVAKFDLVTFLKKPMTYIASFLPIFDFSFDTGTTKTTPDKSTGKVKPTIDSTASRPIFRD